MRHLIGSSLAALAIAVPANASCWWGGSTPEGPCFETYTGGDYDGRAASLSSSSIWSPFGPVTEPGFRLKMDGFASVYGETNATVFSSSFMAADLTNLSEVMAGYQFNYRGAVIKLYAGAGYQVQTRIYPEIGLIMAQNDWGAAAAIQTYWPVSDRVSVMLNMSWLQTGNATSVYARESYEIYRSASGALKISTGVEASVSLNNADEFGDGKALDLYNNYVRGGALLNLRYGRNDLSLSGGLSQASDEWNSRPYASVSYGRQF
ncbi:MAG: hypothetical protein ACLPX9_21295 [Rhodomicrobium sp.]